MKTLIVGAGAIGGTIAVLMKQGGYDIEILERGDENARLMETKGITLTGARGEHTQRFKAYGDVSQLEEKYDICFIATKSLQLEEAAKSILPHIKDDALVVSMQNGICIDLLASIVGKERTVGCMIGFGATMLSRGNVEMTSSGMFYIGMMPGCTSPKLNTLKDMFSAVLKTTVTEDIRGRLYSKLIINCCINSASALTGLPLGEVIVRKEANKMFLEVAREGMKVAKAMNIKVPKYGVMLDYRFLTFSKLESTDHVLRFFIILIGKFKYGSVKPSTLQSLERGEKTEIDIFNGYVANKGDEYGLSVPVCKKITQMVKEIEEGSRKITPDNLLEFSK